MADPVLEPLARAHVILQISQHTFWNAIPPPDFRIAPLSPDAGSAFFEQINLNYFTIRTEDATLCTPVYRTEKVIVGTICAAGSKLNQHDINISCLYEKHTSTKIAHCAVDFSRYSVLYYSTCKTSY